MNLDSSRVVILTGASRGIGRATAKAVAARGCKVSIFARSKEALDELAPELRKLGAADVLPFPGDVRDADAAARWIQAVLNRWKRIDALLNVAGIGIMKPVAELSDEDFLAVLETNLVAPFRLSRAVLEPMTGQGGGHILNVSSIAGEVAFAGGGAYCASKFGLHGFSESLMAEVRRVGIKVTLLCPGSVDTRFDSNPDQDTSWKISPEEVARTIVSILESAANAIPSKIHLRPTLQGK